MQLLYIVSLVRKVYVYDCFYCLIYTKTLLWKQLKQIKDIGPNDHTETYLQFNHLNINTNTYFFDPRSATPLSFNALFSTDS